MVSCRMLAGSPLAAGFFEMPDGAVQLRVVTWPHGRRQAVTTQMCEQLQRSASTVVSGYR